MYCLSDVRHQDACLHYVQEAILERILPEEIEELPEVEEVRHRDRDKIPKEKEKKKIPESVKVKFEIKLTGDGILSGKKKITTARI